MFTEIHDEIYLYFLFENYNCNDADQVAVEVLLAWAMW